MNPRRSSGKLSITLAICLTSVLAALLFVLYQGQIFDWLKVKQYTPSSAIVSLADNSGMNEHGRFLFYTGQPELANATKFNASCGNHERSTAVLGCYVSRNIYLFDVENYELAGVEEVTAAHEMLHAAYERLSVDDKRQVDTYIENYLPTLRRDKAFTERMKVYDDLSDADRLNELHSVIGTEIKKISPDLEKYYSQYFTQRSEVVDLYENYSNVFISLEKRSKVLAAEYNQLVERRNSMVRASNREYQALEAAINAFERGPKTDKAAAEELNARADAFNAKLAQLKVDVAAIDARLEKIKQELDDISVHNQKLNESIDSQLTVPTGSV